MTRVIDEINVELENYAKDLEVSLIDSDGNVVLDELEVNANIEKDAGGMMEVSEADVGDLEEIIEDLSEDAEEALEESNYSELPGLAHSELVEEEPQDTDWVNDNDHKKFTVYVVKMMDTVPKHSGNTETGCERAIGYLQAIDKEISRAIRSDNDGILDEEEVEELRNRVRGYIESLEGRKDQLRDQNKKRRTKSASEQKHNGTDCPECDAPLYDGKCIANNCSPGTKIVKEATVAKITLTMDPFQRFVTGTLISAEVTGGKNIEEVYASLKDKYKFTDRDEASIQQILADMGYPLFKDRGLIGEEDQHPSNSNRGSEFQSNYFA